MGYTSHRDISTWYATASTWIPDFSALVMAPPLPGADISLWPIIGKLNDGTEISKFEWVEHELMPITFTTAEAMDTTETGMDITTADVAKAGLRAGTLVRNVLDTKTEIMLITAMADADTATVVRDYGGYVSGSGGGTTGEEHDSGATFEVIGYLNFEGSSVASGTYDKFARRNRSLAYNYYSELDDFTSVSAEDLVRTYRGTYPNNWGYQLDGVKQRLDRIFERHLWHSPMVTGSATAAGSMGGLRWFATQSTQTTAGAYSSSAITFSYEAFDDGVKFFYDNGVLDGPHDIVCLMPPAGIQAAAYIHEAALQGDYSNETVRGLRCTRMKSTITGESFPLVPCGVIPTDSFMLLNLDSLRIHFLKGYGLTALSKAVGENMDLYQAARLVSIQTLEAQRPTENMYYHTGVTYTRPS